MDCTKRHHDPESSSALAHVLGCRGGGFGRVNNAAFSPSGQCLAVACTNGVWLWGDGVQVRVIQGLGTKEHAVVRA